MWTLPLEWGLIFAGLSGLGRFVLPRNQLLHYRAFDAFWGGVCLLVAFLQLAHLFEPIRPGTGAALIGVGLALSAPYLLRARLSAVPRHWPLFLPILLFVAWATRASFNSPPQWDFGLYHLPSVRWAQTYAVVPGLANLHWALGHNSTFFLLTAAFDDGRLSQVEAYHITAGLFVVVLAAEGCLALHRIATAPAWQPPDVFRALGIPLAGMLIGNWLPTLSPDVAVTVVGYVAASRLADMLLDSRQESSSAMHLVVALSLTGMTLKLSAGIYFAAIMAVGLATSRRRIVWTWRAAAAVGAVSAIFLVPWTIRNIVMSGYPFYPLTWLPVQFPWLVPAEVVRRHALETIWHTRGVGQPSPGGAWVSVWLRHILWTAGKFQVLLPLMIGAGAVLSGSAVGSLRYTRWMVAFLLPPVIGAAAWVATAPEPRLAGAIFWHLGIGLVLASVLSDQRRLQRSSRRVALAGVMSLLVLYIIVGARSRQFRASALGAAAPEVPRLRTFVTETGLRVLTPIGDDRCHDAPLPCTPEPNLRLRLRRPGELGRGFEVRRQPD